MAFPTPCKAAHLTSRRRQHPEPYESYGRAGCRTVEHQPPDDAPDVPRGLGQDTARERDGKQKRRQVAKPCFVHAGADSVVTVAAAQDHRSLVSVTMSYQT